MRFCGHTPGLQSCPDYTEETTVDFLLYFSKICSFFVVLWYATTAVVHVTLMKVLPHSSKPHENSSVYVAQKFVAEFKCIIVSILANMAVWHMLGQPGHEIYGPNIEAEMAGIVFVSFEVTDLVLGSLHGFMDRMYVVHHVMHIVLGLIIRCNCILGYTTAILASQETSSCFLNYYLLMRHRSSHWSVALSRNLFAVAFSIWRMGLNTYGTAYFLRYYVPFMPPMVSPWQLHTMAVVLVLATSLQWFWGYEIIRLALRPASAKAKKTNE